MTTKLPGLQGICQNHVLALPQGMLLAQLASSWAVRLVPCLPEEFLRGCSHGHAGCAPWKIRVALRAVKPAGHPRHQVAWPAFIVS